ncbi:MAG: glycosyltransferase family 2 protein, partial [Candidatus Micrarchaeaceae archaeon]
SVATIDEFYRRSVEAAEALGYEVEVIMVNDGSPDESLERALRLQRGDPRLVVVDLSRNYGHHRAMMVGLSHARGERVFVLDSDLEEQPEDLSRLHERFVRGDCDVVYGVQERRRGSILQQLPGELFFFFVKLLSDYPVSRNTVCLRLMSRDYVRALVRHRDREFMMIHLMELAGFRQVAIPIHKLSRSTTTYSLMMRIDMAVKYLTTTSTRLLRLILYAGLLILAFSAAGITYIVGRYLASGNGVSGFTSIIVSIWFFGGLIVAILGVLGIYIANILGEVKRRPYAVVRCVHRAQAATKNAPAASVHPDSAYLESPGVHRVSNALTFQERSSEAGEKTEFADAD